MLNDVELCRRAVWETFLVNSGNLLKIKKPKLSLLVSSLIINIWI